LKGSYFGECEIIERIHREDTTQAYGNCEFLVLESKQFRNLLEEYPDEAEQIKAIAAEKSKRTKDSKEELIRLLTVKHRSGDLKTVSGMLRYGAREL
jgi:CRP-like cAMP-binding protein